MISQPLFFGPDDWIADHAEWRERTQSGKTGEIAPFPPEATSTCGGLPLRLAAA